ncbi:MAG: ferrochelatase [Deltaproteobacteria bacterium]|nr:ferrochelatase [Deltaproteobacteria bacterium]
MQKKALVLLNLGTPDSTQIRDVRKYLKEFLSDPRVIDSHPLIRWMILHLFILPFRPAKSAKAYRAIWSAQGSPLLIHTKNLATNIQKITGPNVYVTYMMRYQNPSIKTVMTTLQEKGFDKITVVPLFPQYSSAASGSATEAIFRHISHRWNVPEIEVLSEFYREPEFIQSSCQIGIQSMREEKFDKILFSFHGLPERHCRKSDESSGHQYCLQRDDCCASINDSNRRCYRAQCFATAQAMASELRLSQKQWEVAFQSRLGRTPWITPYTDERITALPSEGVKNLGIFVPSFVADCLETLEEIGIRAREDFIRSGGHKLTLIPALNASEIWARGLCDIIRRRSSILS